MKRIVWKPTAGTNCDGEPILYRDLFSHRGVDFLREILSMQKAQPISLEVAVELYADTLSDLMDSEGGRATGEYINQKGGFLGIISHLGYHIHLTGREYIIYSD